MDESIEKMVTGFGKAVLQKDWAGACRFFAPWMVASTSPARLQQIVEQAYRETLDPNSELHHPGNPDPIVDGNDFTTASSLREPISWHGNKTRNIPAEVTDENMKYWASVQLCCSEEQQESLELDFLAELWVAVVETSDGPRIGYLTTDPDRPD